MRLTPRHVDRGRSDGFTLIEVLMVIVLLTIITTLGAAGLSSTGLATEFIKAKGNLRKLDAHARLVARTSGASVLMRLEPGTRRFELDQRDESGPLDEFSLPTDLSVHIEMNGVTTDHVLFDRLGRTPDYSVIIAGPGHQSRLQVAGLTGAIVAQELTP